MCEREDDDLKNYVRVINFSLTFIVWILWLASPEKIMTINDLKIGIVQVFIIDSTFS